MEGASLVKAEVEWLSRLREKLEPHVEPAVDTLVQLMASKRDSVRMRAAEKLLELYSEAEAAERGRGGQGGGRVVVVTAEAMEAMSRKLSHEHQQRLAASREF